MKKLLTLACALVAALTLLGVTACAPERDPENVYTVYAPDGAPALALAELMGGEKTLSAETEYHIVTADTIASYVSYTDQSKNADLIVMPVNAASKILGDGKNYKLLGAVTNGNLFIVSAKDKTELTKDNFKTEIDGKKVGVVQLPQFPGVMFKTLLSIYETSAELTAVQPGAVSGVSTDFDYFVIPEPAATTRVNNASLNLKFAGDLQSLYGENGYPQAVLLAKNSVIESDAAFINEFTAALSSANDYLKNTSAETILNTIKSHYADPDNTTPTFTNLSAAVIDHCKIDFRPASACKGDVKSLLSAFYGIDSTFAKEVTDDFFYAG